MATVLAVDSAHHTAADSFTTGAPAHQHNNNNTATGNANNTSSNSFSSSNSNSNSNSNNCILDAHRQSHNSSKLPAFRFADLLLKKKDAVLPSLPSLLQHIPPSPVSPQTETADGQPPQHLPQRSAPADPLGSQEIGGVQHDSLSDDAQMLPDKSPRPETAPLKSLPPHQASPPRTRASTFQQTSSAPTSARTTTNPDPPVGSKRPASFPDAPTIARISRTQSSYIVTPAAKRRLTASAVANSAQTLTSNPVATTPSGNDASSARDLAQGQRDLLLPRTVETTKSDDRRKSRPPVSFRPPNPTSGRAVIPPIRSFRSSGSRKSLNLDMHIRRVSNDSYGEDVADTNQRDRTLRALEGRQDDDYARMTPPDSADAIGDSDNTADLFMRIAAHEEPTQAPTEREKPAEQSAISRITRASHRRPLSAAVPTYRPSSPPQVTRRLSDQRDNSRARQLADSRSPQQMSREFTYRASVRERPISGTTTVVENSGRAPSSRTPVRPSPITPRQIQFQDIAQDSSSPSRRRQSLTDSNTGAPSGKISQYRNVSLVVGGQGRTYNSSPLVPRSAGVHKDEPSQGNEAHHGVEGTESSTSTAAPSTVWDELDDLKSRIHRLELTGKMPSTSGAAISRASDERPPTANTNATTVSGSPKRGSGPAATQPDEISTTSSQKESQPLLLSALSKTKGIVSPAVFGAIESAATDALALTAMIGAPGQLGPISSGASTIGGMGSLTDRQLRRKADSVCRSLTELCIALADEAGPAKASQSRITREKDVDILPSPAVAKFAPIITQRRPSILNDSATAKSGPASPRAPTSLEQRRITMLASTNLPSPSPRYATAPATNLEASTPGRKTSLLISRLRRAGTEEPEETAGRRSSLLLRTRRAGTEEPEENREPQQGRKTSFFVRSQKLSNDDEDESRFRVPSRAITEVNSFRTAPREVNTNTQTSPPDQSSLGSSALPRRRLGPSSLNPRLGAPSAPSTPLTRRYLDRPTSNRDAGVEKVIEERAQRQYSLNQTPLLNRSGSLGSRRTRENSVPSTQNNQAAGSYR